MAQNGLGAFRQLCFECLVKRTINEKIDGAVEHEEQVTESKLLHAYNHHPRYELPRQTVEPVSCLHIHTTENTEKN